MNNKITLFLYFYRKKISHFGNNVVVVQYPNQVGAGFHEIIDVLPGTPANATFVPGSATFNSSPLADPIIVGQALHWATPFVIVSGAGTPLCGQLLVR